MYNLDIKRKLYRWTHALYVSIHTIEKQKRVPRLPQKSAQKAPEGLKTAPASVLKHVLKKIPKRPPPK